MEIIVANNSKMTIDSIGDVNIFLLNGKNKLSAAIKNVQYVDLRVFSALDRWAGASDMVLNCRFHTFMWKNITLTTQMVARS